MGVPATAAFSKDTKAALDLMVLVDDNYLPTPEDLAAVRVDEDGVLSNNHIQRPAPAPRTQATTPRPSDDPGVPLPEHVITAIDASTRFGQRGCSPTDQPTCRCRA